MSKLPPCSVVRPSNLLVLHRVPQTSNVVANTRPTHRLRFPTWAASCWVRPVQCITYNITDASRPLRHISVFTKALSSSSFSLLPALTLYFSLNKFSTSPSPLLYRISELPESTSIVLTLPSHHVRSEVQYTETASPRSASYVKYFVLSDLHQQSSSTTFFSSLLLVFAGSRGYCKR